MARGASRNSSYRTSVHWSAGMRSLARRIAALPSDHWNAATSASECPVAYSRQPGGTRNFQFPPS